jgi:hypothetical protein
MVRVDLTNSAAISRTGLQACCASATVTTLIHTNRVRTIEVVRHNSVTGDNAAAVEVDTVAMTQTAEREHASTSASRRAQPARLHRRLIGTVIAASAALLIVACSTDSGADGSDTSATATPATTSTTAQESSTSPQSTATAMSSTADPAEPTEQAIPDQQRCTDQINYAGDPRSNAEINSIGETTGTCPDPITSAAPTS